MTVTGVVFLLVAITEIALEPGGAKVFGAVTGAFSAVLVYRAPRAGLVVDDFGITNRTVEWTHRIPWCEIASTGPAVGISASGLGTSLTLVTHEGRRIVLRGLAGYSTRRTTARLQKTKAQLDARIADHRTSCPTCARPGPA
ncbi:hypothetical protein [Kitasatospora sp. NPDC096204]|uniref:hypothetical protein n=1 Tax=Kitasatospora sp. NPDC096204 TaxID=3364094 RepID=UPI0037FF5454